MLVCPSGILKIFTYNFSLRPINLLCCEVTSRNWLNERVFYKRRIKHKPLTSKLYKTTNVIISLILCWRCSCFTLSKKTFIDSFWEEDIGESMWLGEIYFDVWYSVVLYSNKSVLLYHHQHKFVSNKITFQSLYQHVSMLNRHHKISLRV